MVERRRRRQAAWSWGFALVLVVTGAFALGRVATLGETPAAAPLGDGPAPGAPLLSPRRALSFLAVPVADRRLDADLAAFVADQPADTCLAVSTSAAEQPLFAHDAQRPLVPASAQKLLTAVAVLLDQPPDRRFRTELASAAPVSDGTLAGDLFLVGGGDPVLATPEHVAGLPHRSHVYTDLTVLADQIAESGIARVEGAVVGDESRYDSVRHVELWPPRFVTQDQTGPLSALYVNDGFVEQEPEPDPPTAAAELLAAELEARGVAVTGPPRAGVAPPEATVLAAAESPPLAEIVAQMLSRSDNSVAELLVKELGVSRAGQGSTAAGRTAVTEILAAAGLGTGELVVADGSGLASQNRASCAALIAALTHDPTEGRLLDGLAVAGRSGTLSARWAGTELEGRVRAKTGTLNQVSALAGVVDTVAGPPLSFALVVNVDAPERIGEEVVSAQETLARTLLDYPRHPEVERLRPTRPAPLGGVAAS